MKRVFVFTLCVLLLPAFVGCSSATLESGYFYLVGDYEEPLIPYVNLCFEDNSFAFGAGLIVDYAERGNFTVCGQTMTATTTNTTFVFEIKRPTLIKLIDCGEYEPFQQYVGSEFVYRFDL